MEGMSDRIGGITEMVRAFREAASDPDVRSAHVGYAQFPKGSCTWASFAFGRLLQELEPDRDWHLVNGTNPGQISGHDWLEDGCLAVDVTADQFAGLDPYIGQAPAPAAAQWRMTQRYELAEAHAPYLKALKTIRQRMKLS